MQMRIDFHERLSLGGHTPRDIAVYLPLEYDSAQDRRYPVMYLKDGQNLFDASRSYAGAWDLDDAADHLIRQGVVTPVILVAIANAGVGRLHEYTPTTNDGEGGGAGRYADYVVSVVKPWIDATYRTRAGRRETAVGGSSLGALASIEMVRRHPSVFGHCAILSPSVWWDDQAILELLAATPIGAPLYSLWISTGMNEGRDAAQSGRQVLATRALRDACCDAGWVHPSHTRLAYHEIPGAGHNETSWGLVAGDMLATVFPAARSHSSSLP